jgi:hypothetical protein
MTREELEHIIRACGAVTDQYEFIIVGSQSILGSVPNPEDVFTMWAVDFDYLQRKEIIKVPVGTGLGGVATLPGFEGPQGELSMQFEERWTGGYIFENEWQSFRTRQSRELELTTALHTYDRPGRYTVAVKVIDIFGNDTMTLVPVNVG